MRILLILFCLSFLTAHGQRLEIHAPPVLTAVMIDHSPTVYFELRVKNISKDTLTFQSVEINGKAGSWYNYLNIISSDLPRRSGHPSKIGPGDTSVIYVEFTLGSTLPTKFIHRIRMETPWDPTIVAEQNTRSFVETGYSRLSRKSPVSIGPPLQGGPWCAVYDPFWERGHRRVIYHAGGKEYIPGRFAIDLIKLDQGGHYAYGNEDSIQNWLGYATPVLAVADGVVSSMKDSFPESPAVSGHINPASDKATGNYVSLKIGKGLYVFYEHLKPGSIRVKPGQTVKQGQVIAALGFTGQTTGPHLHLHVADRDSPLGAEGLPFVFGKFQTLGRYDHFEDFGKKTWTPGREEWTEQERPASNAVIRFREDAPPAAHTNK